VLGNRPQAPAPRASRWRQWRLGAAGRDPWSEANAAVSLRRSLSFVTVGTVTAMLAGIAGLVITLDVVVPALTPAGHTSWAVAAVQVLLGVDGLAFALVLTMLVRERLRLAVLGSHLATERAREEANRHGVALQGEHMRVVLGVAERLAGSVSVEDISAVVTAAAKEITGALGATLWLMEPGGGLVPAVHGAAGRPPVRHDPDGKGWAISLVASGEVVGVLEIAGIRRPPTAVATVVEALATHTAGAVEVTRRYAKLREASFIDPLTGLPNRGALDLALLTECERANRTGSDLAVVMVDIDHFKTYNDLHGHPEGDAALRAVARVLAKGLRRRGDGAYRYGGEEFAIVLPGTDGESGVAVAERLRQGVAEAADTGAIEFPVTASFGVAARAPSRRAPAELLRAADAALYLAKQAGRDRVELITGESPPPG
jgi:diguanylate cyclase (GGDEF)-like protein